MSTSPAAVEAASSAGAGSGTDAGQTVYTMIGAVAVAHLINDLIQAVIPAIYPIIKESYGLSFTQIGLITLSYQITASLLQPAIGFSTDRHPRPFLLPIGMGITLLGTLLLSLAHGFLPIVGSVMLVGLGSAIFHPEGSRVARMASGGKFGLAQSTFQVGGNSGSALGPLLAAAIVVPYGQSHVAWFGVFGIAAIALLYRVSTWYSTHLEWFRKKKAAASANALPKSKVMLALGILALLVFSKFFYLASFTSYYTFYLIERFRIGVPQAQFYLFLFLGAVAAGTFLGGPIGDRIGRKAVIWFSILGVAPFSLLMPRVDLFWTAVLSMIIGFILASAFSAIVVYAQELVPGNVGMIAGIFFGMSFGFAGIAAALLGKLADWKGIVTVYEVCAYLPLIGVVTAFLPDLKKQRKS